MTSKSQDRLVIKRVLSHAQARLNLARELAVCGDEHQAAVYQLKANQMFNAVSRRAYMIAENKRQAEPKPVVFKMTCIV
jgi:hypothetical protein